MTIKLLCIIEATTVIGPAKNLLNFARRVRSPEFAVEGAPPVEVSIVTFDRSLDRCTQTPNAFVATAREQNISVDVIHERFRFDPEVIRQLRMIVAHRAPDVIQTHMIKSHFLVKLSGLGKEYPWVAYHHGYTSTDLKMLLYNRLNRWSLPSADRVITVCGAFARQLSHAGVRPERLAVRHNSVVPPKSLSGFEQHALRKKLAIGEDERVILAIGRLSREKGHADLLHSIAAAREVNPEFKLKLLLVGDGPECTRLQTIANTLALDEVVIFVGHVSDVTPFYAIADVFALPSHSEGSPNVLLEAMAAGLPVVATSVGGVPEIVTDERDALLVPAREPNAFAEALRRALAEPDLAQKLKKSGVARALDFSPEAYAHSLIEIYEQLTTPTGEQACSLQPQPRQRGKRGRLRSSQIDPI